MKRYLILLPLVFLAGCATTAEDRLACENAILTAGLASIDSIGNKTLSDADKAKKADENAKAAGVLPACAKVNQAVIQKIQADIQARKAAPKP